MRSEQEVIEKLKDVWHKCLERKKREYLNCGYKNCVYNIRCRVKGNGSVRFCSNPNMTDVKNKSIFVCNQDGIARSCEYYKCKNTEGQVIDSFRDEVSNPSVCGKKYPKLAVLLWFLQKTPNVEYKPNIFDRLKLLFK